MSESKKNKKVFKKLTVKDLKSVRGGKLDSEDESCSVEAASSECDIKAAGVKSSGVKT